MRYIYANTTDYSELDEYPQRMRSEHSKQSIRVDLMQIETILLHIGIGCWMVSRPPSLVVVKGHYTSTSDKVVKLDSVFRTVVVLDCRGREPVGAGDGKSEATRQCLQFNFSIFQNLDC